MAIELFNFLNNAEMPEAFVDVQRDQIRNRLQANLIAASPLIDTSISQPASQLLDVFSSYLALTFAYHNNKYMQTLTRFAVDNNLFEIARNNGIDIIAGEPQSRLRQRIESSQYTSPLTKNGLEGILLNLFSDIILAIESSYDIRTGVTTLTPLSILDVEVPPIYSSPGILTQANKDRILAVDIDSSSFGLATDFAIADPTINSVYITVSVNADDVDEVKELLLNYNNVNFTLGNSILIQNIFNLLSDYRVSLTKLNLDNSNSVVDLLRVDSTTAYLITEARLTVEINST